MTVMILGLVLFLGIHLVPAAGPLRGNVAARLGEKHYKGLFSATSLAGLVLIVVGYRHAVRGERVFEPLASAHAAAPFVVTLAFILLASAHMHGHLRRVVQHPMLVGVVLWSLVHLLANGDLRGTILFGSILAWAIIDLVASYARGPIAPYVPRSRHDVIAVAAGVVVAGAVALVHQPLFGVRPI